GSRRLVAVRERPNVRHAFDAARLILANGSIRNELFYAGYVASREGIFDDKWINKETRFWGNYFSFASPLKFPKTDLYYFGIERQNAVADDAVGRQVRQSLGVRFHNEGSFSYDIEGVYQFGTFNAKRIKAWTASANLNRAFKKLKHEPEIGLKMDYISGDRLANDNRINTFDALFPNGSYFGLGSFVGPANLIDLHPSFRYHFSKIITANIDYDIFWRASTDDGIYGPNAMLSISGKNIDNRFVGHQLGFDFNIDPNRFVHMQVDGIYFKAGSYLKNATAGKDLLFFAFTSTLKF
ncbi:MAG: alginate export family protein, partial [Ferruginibacter sp.]|nr:alginate export family protein [Ferruginibacter sp.]